jgi:putative selenate reductase FAD-binding subunit
MILEYFRPKTIEEAIVLLKRDTPKSYPLGGGSSLSHDKSEDLAVVDLQDLGLNGIKRENGKIVIGATTKLSEIEAFMGKSCFSDALQIEAGRNLLNSGSIAGLICTADGRSPFVTLLLALDTQLVWEDERAEISLGDWLPLRKEWKGGRLITKIVIPETDMAFDSIGRSPKDRPIVCCATAKWSTNRMRVAIGGFGITPILVIDGKNDDDLAAAVNSACSEADDEWASASYRQEAGSKLAIRLQNQLAGTK